MVSEDPYFMLLQAAILGVERVPVPATLDQALQPAGLPLPASADDALLHALATWRLWQKAGSPIAQLPLTAMAPPGDPTEYCLGPALQDQLQQLLCQPFLSSILPEFLTLIQRKGLKLANWQVPLVANWMLGNPDRPLAIETVLDATGQWLMKQHPQWRKLLEPVVDTTSASASERIQEFAQQRRLDPAAARAWLAAGWAGESPENKVALLHHFSWGIGPEDLPFLQAALADRRREVRQLAADLVARVPGNPLVEHYRQWLGAILQYRPLAATRSKVFQLQVPATIPSEWQQWGVEAVKGKKNHDAGVTAVYQLLRRLPPLTLARQLELNPGQVLAVVDAGPHGEIWIKALVDAILLHQAADWVPALVEHWLRYHPEEGWNNSAFLPVLDLLPVADFQHQCTEHLANLEGLISDAHLLNHLLQRPEQPWTLELAQGVLVPVIRQLHRGGPWPWGAWHYLNILSNLALQAPPELLSWLETHWPETLLVQNKWAELREKIQQTLRFRAEMHALLPH